MKSESVIREVECELVDLDRIKELCPLIRTEDLQGGIWIPGDGVANPFEICLALSVLAHKVMFLKYMVIINYIFSQTYAETLTLFTLGLY
jgi:glycine/D-amino acid oxidase-like deaminating enzyme